MTNVDRMPLIALFLVLACQGASAQTTHPILTIHPHTFIGPPIVGFGAQMNPYLYAKPNWGEGGVTEENVKDLEQKVIDLRPQFVRVFVVPNWKTGTPDGVNKRGEPRMWQSMLRTLRLAAKAGANITLTTWYGYPSRPEDTAKETVAMLVDLLDNEKIDAIKSINMMNEPDMDWPNEENWTIDQYNRLYKTLDAELKRVNLRDRLQIISGDMVEDYQPKWMTNIAANLAELSDGISIHAYWRYDRTPFMLHRLDETKEMVAARPSIHNKPLYVTEFGSQGINDRISGHEPWKTAEGVPMCETNIQAIQIGEFMMQAVNRGFSGTVQWDMYDVAYDRLMHYGVIGEAKKSWPLKPAYFVLQMFTHTTRPGWRAIKTDLHGGQLVFLHTESPGVRGTKIVETGNDLLATAMQGPKGELTVWLLNRQSKPHTLDLVGLPNQPLKLITWNGDGKARLSSSEVRPQNSTFTVLAPPESIVTVTTTDPGL